MRNVLITLLTLCLVLSSCNVNITNQITDTMNNISSTQNVKNPYINSSKNNNLKTLEDAIKDSYIVVRATYLGNTHDDEIINSADYQFLIDEFIKGNTDENTITINMNDDITFINDNNSRAEFYEKDNDYILILDKFESVYIGDSYMISWGFMISMDNDRISKIYQFGEPYEQKEIDSITSFKNMVNGFLKNTEVNGNTYGCSYTMSSQASEIVDFSPIIVKVKIIEDISISGAQLNTFSVETTELLKGQFPQSAAITVFKEDNIIIGNEYLFLLSELSTTEAYEPYSLSSKDSCIPVSDTETYNEYMKYIE